MNFPAHKGSLFLTHNEHRNYYESATEWLAQNNERAPFATPEERQRAIDTDSIWVLQWYPITPIGFFVVAASTLEGVMAFAAEVKRE